MKSGQLVLKADDLLYELQNFSKNPTLLNSTKISTSCNEVQKLLVDQDHLLLFYKDKVISTQLKDGHLINLDQSTYPTCQIVGTAISPQNIWISSSHGLMKFCRKLSSSPVELINHSFIDPYSVNSNHQSGVFVDKMQNLWVSTWSGGLSYTCIDKSKFNLVRYLPSSSTQILPNEFVTAIHTDITGSVYVGTKFGGVSRFNTHTASFDYTLNLKDKLKYDAIVPCFASDGEWLYAVATSSGSSIIRINKSSKSVELVKSFQPHTIFSMGFDAHHQLWVGALGLGLTKLKILNGKVVDEKLFTTLCDPIHNLSSN